MRKRSPSAYAEGAPVKIVPEMTYYVSSGTLSLYTTTAPKKAVFGV